MFAVPFDEALANLVPGALVVPGGIGLPHTNEVTRLARNHGYTVPAPILVQYDWNNDTPFQTQKITAAMLTMNKRAYVLSEMGVGKTRAALYAFDFLKEAHEVDCGLVIAPLSTLNPTWAREILKYFPDLTFSIVHGTKAQRLGALARPADLYIINHDGIKTVLPELIAKTEIDLVIVDELAAFRTPNTDRSKALAQVLKERRFAWGLTGAPTPNEPTDAWNQCRLITPERVPKYMKQFRDSTMRQVSQFRWIEREEAKDIVHEAMQPAVRYKRDDCVELPPKVIMDREVELSSEQKRVYQTLMKKLSVMFKQGEVTAANEGVLFMKLLQIASGWVYTSDKSIVDLGPKSRLDALEEIIDQAEGKVIVFAEFVHAAEALYKHLSGKGICSVALVTGSTNRKDRDQIFNEFQNAAFPRVIVAHPRCMAHGLTLTAASIVVWFTPTPSLEIYDQACARISRPGQTRKQLIIHLTGSAVETKMYRRLEKKASTQGALLELFEDEGA
jgi:SNF2 family DNA or RNA helicase